MLEGFGFDILEELAEEGCPGAWAGEHSGRVVVRVVGVEGWNGLFRLSMSIYSKSRWTLVMLDWEGSAGGAGEGHVT